MNTTVKIYGYTKRINDYMAELDYKEYRMDGSLYSMGTEQFSNERMDKQLKGSAVYVWDGKKRNKGGYRVWDRKEFMWYTNRKALNEYVKNKYADYAMIQFRSY